MQNVELIDQKGGKDEFCDERLPIPKNCKLKWRVVDV